MENTESLGINARFPETIYPYVITLSLYDEYRDSLLPHFWR
ncbi:MAG: hypothetical protein RL335_1317 [Bacteroidota bacterium]